MQNDELKKVFSNNLVNQMKMANINTSELARRIGAPFTTVNDWVHGRKYPRMDKVQQLADFFGILKSDLTENKPISTNIEDPIDQKLYDRLKKASPEMKKAMLLILEQNQKEK